MLAGPDTAFAPVKGPPVQPDPAILVQDANPTPPPTHRHSQWWQDPRTNEVGAHLVHLLTDRNHDLHGGRPWATGGKPEAQSPVMPRPSGI